MFREANDYERNIYENNDRYLTASDNGTSLFALQFNVDRAVLNDVLSDCYVPIFKLLPGYLNEGGSLSVVNGKLVTGGEKSTKLGRQTLTVNQ